MGSLLLILLETLQKLLVVSKRGKTEYAVISTGKNHIECKIQTVEFAFMLPTYGSNIWATYPVGM